MLLKFISLIALFALSLAKAEYSLVLLWDSSSPSEPALRKIDSKTFTNYIKSDATNSMIVVFFDNQSVEYKDFSACKTSSGEKCFTKLSQMKNKVFYPNVENPVETLRNLNMKTEYVEFDKNGKLQTPVEYEEGKMIIVTLSEIFNDDDANNKKPDTLHKRDSIIYEIYQQFSTGGKTVGLYTKINSNKLSRKVRQTQEQQQQQQQNSNKTGFAFNVNDKFLIYFKNLSLKTEDSKIPTEINVQEVTLHNSTDNGFEIEITGKDNHKIKFDVNLRDYWSLKNFKYNDKLLRIEPTINAAKQFSYYCGNQEMYDSEHKTTLVWNHLQIEPMYNKKTSVNISFNDPWHCVGFTSTGIWSGLFVTFMMLAILSIGITWLMDIRTMDRFDDAKGKTITVNASD